MATFKDDFHVYLHLIALIGLMSRAINFKQALASQGGATLMLFAFARPVSTGMTDTGVAAMLGRLVTLASCGNMYLAVILIYVVVALATQFLDNRTIVTMLQTSIAEACVMIGMPTVPIITLLVNAGVANFMSPIGCSHNQFATVAGNYSFGDFLRAGWVLQLAHMGTCCLFIILWIQFAETAVDVSGLVLAQ